MIGPFDLILSDPPWAYADKGQSGSGVNNGSATHYSTMSTDEICALDVPVVAAPDSLCFLWVTAPHIPSGLKVLEAWGFAFKTVAFTWVKTGTTDRAEVALKDAMKLRGVGATSMNGILNDTRPHLLPAFAIGQGSYSRANAEFVLLGRKGRGVSRVDAGVRSEVLAPRREHSQKPDEVAARIERLFGDAVPAEVGGRIVNRPIRRLEMFARAPRRGWYVHGDEVRADVRIEAKGATP